MVVDAAEGPDDAVVALVDADGLLATAVVSALDFASGVPSLPAVVSYSVHACAMWKHQSLPIILDPHICI